MLPVMYIRKYYNYDVESLIDELVSDEDRNWVKSFTLSVLITQRVYDSGAFSVNGNDEETRSQVATELFIQTYILKRKINYQEVYRILRSEFHIQFNWVGSQSEYLGANTLNHFQEELKRKQDNSIDYFDEICEIGQFKSDVIELSPDRLKLYVTLFLRTLQPFSKHYPLADRYLIDVILLESGYTMEYPDYKFLSELETLHDKAVFLSVLAVEEPELFILLTSVNDIGRFLLLLQYQKLFKTRKNIALILEGVARKAKSMTNQDYKVDEIMILLAEKLNLVLENTDIVEILNRHLDKLSEEYDVMLDKMVKRASVTGNYLQIGNLLQKETAQSVAILDNFRKSKVGNVVFKK